MIDNISKEDSDLLIELLEMLFQEWYIASHKRKERLAKIREAKEKTNSSTTKPAKKKNELIQISQSQTANK